MSRSDLNRCTHCRGKLSDYVDGALPAGIAWELEKHLASCDGCAGEAERLRLTVQALRGIPALDTSDDFMARLHARLDNVTPARPSVVGGLSERWAAFASSLRSPVAQVAGFCAAALAAVALFTFKPSTAPQGAAAPLQSLQRSVALAAANPFEDPLAANLEAHAAQDRSSGLLVQETD